MRSIPIIPTKISKVLSGGTAALILSLSMMNSSNAAVNIATTYNNSCAACHDSGALNAIKKGDSAQWQRLIQKKGMPALINSVKSGMIQMPAGGLCDSCSDDDYRKLIEYMSK